MQADYRSFEVLKQLYLDNAGENKFDMAKERDGTLANAIESHPAAEMTSASHSV